MTEKIEAITVDMKASNGKHIRKVTRILIDGNPIDFTEKLTNAQIAKYIAARKQLQDQIRRNEIALEGIDF